MSDNIISAALHFLLIGEAERICSANKDISRIFLFAALCIEAE
jgi:hypothetical protein